MNPKTGTYQGRAYRVTGTVVYQGSDEDGPWEYTEYTLVFDDGRKAWLEEDEGNLILWAEPDRVGGLKTKDGKALRLDPSTRTVRSSDGSSLSFRPGFEVLLDSTLLRVKENEVVKVLRSDDPDMDAGETLWYVDAMGISGTPKWYSIEVYSDGSMEKSTGTRASSRDFSWAKSGSPLKGVGSLLIVLLLAGAGLAFLEGTESQSVAVTVTCQQCLDSCGDLNQPSANWTSILEVDCARCAQACLLPGGSVNRTHHFTHYRTVSRGPRSYGQSTGGK